MYPKKLHKFGAAMTEIMMKMRRWRMLKAMGIPRNIIGVEAAVLGQMPLVREEGAGAREGGADGGRA
jgi:hypothetical protein